MHMQCMFEVLRLVVLLVVLQSMALPVSRRMHYTQKAASVQLENHRQMLQVLVD